MKGYPDILLKTKDGEFPWQEYPVMLLKANGMSEASTMLLKTFNLLDVLRPRAYGRQAVSATPQGEFAGHLH
jgi:hypothetical protein